MKMSPPRSRRRLTQPRKRDFLADVVEAKRAAGQPAYHRRIDVVRNRHADSLPRSVPIPAAAEPPETSFRWSINFRSDASSATLRIDAPFDQASDRRPAGRLPASGSSGGARLVRGARISTALRVAGIARGRRSIGFGFAGRARLSPRARLALTPSQVAMTASGVVAETEPKTCGWRRISLRLMPSNTSSMRNAPFSSAICACIVTSRSRSPSSSASPSVIAGVDGVHDFVGFFEHRVA